jgi:hypothetical protein
LAAYEEGWQREHDEAMRCRDFEENLAVGVGIFRALVQVDVCRRQRVASGLEKENAQEDDDMLECFKWWLRSGRQALEQLRHFEGKFGTVDGAVAFRECCQETQEIVSEWRRAALQRAGAGEQRALIAHTNQPLSTAEMAQALDKVSRPTAEESVPLGFNPDDLPLF